jgi:hypothetical protein
MPVWLGHGKRFYLCVSSWHNGHAFPWRKYLLNCLIACLLACLLTCLIAYLLACLLTYLLSGFGGLGVACTKLAGSHPAEAVGFLGRKKILSTPSYGGEVKPSVPCRSFTACKRSLNVTWKSEFRQNFRTFLAHSFTFRRWVLSRGDMPGIRLVAKVGTFNPDRTISLKVCSA